MKNYLRTLVTVFVIIAALRGASANADPITTGGHFKTQAGYRHFRDSAAISALGDQDIFQGDVDARLKFEAMQQQFGFVVHPELLSNFSNSDKFSRAFGALNFGANALSDDRRLFDLSTELGDSERSSTLLRLDRLYLEYAKESLVLRAGRQALTWGNGLVFQVLDLFNPFSPTEIDKDYKSGDDMLYSQYLFSDGSQVDFLLVPRRNPDTQDLEAESSSLAAKYKFSLGQSEFDLLASQHYDQGVFGVGASRELFEGVLRSDLSYSDAEDGAHWSYLLNYDRSFDLIGHNAYYLLEYFHNGFGGEDLFTPAGAPLLDRLERGELYNIERDYLALGLQIELDAKTNLYLNQIFNLSDGSNVFQLRSVFDVAQDLYLTVGANLPGGSVGSEYGGITPPQIPGALDPGTSVYTKIAYYF